MGLALLTVLVVHLVPALLVGLAGYQLVQVLVRVLRIVQIRPEASEAGGHRLGCVCRRRVYCAWCDRDIFLFADRQPSDARKQAGAEPGQLARRLAEFGSGATPRDR